MSIKNVSDFLFDAIEKAEKLTGLENVELTAWHSTGDHRTAKVDVVLGQDAVSHLTFWTTQVPDDWDKKIGQLNPEVIVRGELEKISAEDSKSVMDSLVSSPNIEKSLNVLNVHDTSKGTTALWQRFGWGKYSRDFFSNKLPVSELYNHINKWAEKSGVSVYEIHNSSLAQNSVRVKTEDIGFLKIIRQFAIDQNATITRLQIGQGEISNYLQVEYENAKKLIFPTQLKQIAYGQVNWGSYKHGTVGSVYASDQELRISVNDPSTMLSLAQILL